MNKRKTSQNEKCELNIAEDFRRDYEIVNKCEGRLITIQNIFVALAAMLFLTVQFIEELEAYHKLLHGIAYILGAGSYIMELLILTDCFKRSPNWREMFMPYIFGALYFILGVSYFIKV